MGMEICGAWWSRGIDAVDTVKRVFVACCRCVQEHFSCIATRNISQIICFAFYIGITVYQQMHQRNNPPNRCNLFTCYESKREKGLPRPRKKKKKRDISTQR